MPNEEDIIKSINANPNHGYQPDLEKEPEGEENYSKSREILSFVWETAKIIIISLAIIIPIRYYLVQPFFVKGASMEDNFHDGDYLLIDEINYRFNQPKRGDVIVFRYPGNPSQFYIKRIIGLPGDDVEIKNGAIKINGAPIGEPYLPASLQTEPNSKIKLAKEQYFVLGDNRTRSSDSRFWGTLPKEKIMGRVLVRLWPVAKAGII